MSTTTPPSIQSIPQRIADELGVRTGQVSSAVELLDGGATVPFVARYRKEATGGLDDAQLRTLEERLRYLRELEERRAVVLAEIEKQTRARVLIIEDEPIIAMDIESIVRDLGHDVTGVAVTRDEAVSLAMEDRPGLVLADIQLADDSSGIDAVKDILAKFNVPVIFITAFPERLLTGERPEPTFLITKPFQRSTVKAAISQALFFDQATVPAS